MRQRLWCTRSYASVLRAAPPTGILSVSVIEENWLRTWRLKGDNGGKVLYIRDRSVTPSRERSLIELVGKDVISALSGNAARPGDQAFVYIYKEIVHSVTQGNAPAGILSVKCDQSSVSRKLS
jgi:hypothetical protein